MNDAIVNQKFVTAEELAEVLRVTSRTVRTMVLRGLIRPYRLSNAAVRYDLQEVLQDLREQREVAPSIGRAPRRD
jgi:predicted site-specific integrase-resolvase